MIQKTKAIAIRMKLNKNSNKIIEIIKRFFKNDKSKRLSYNRKKIH